MVTHRLEGVGPEGAVINNGGGGGGGLQNGKIRGLKLFAPPRVGNRISERGGGWGGGGGSEQLLTTETRHIRAHAQHFPPSLCSLGGPQKGEGVLTPPPLHPPLPPPLKERVKLFTPSLLKVGNLWPSVWLNLQAPVLKLP